jgi:hypothetical protein
MATWNPWQTLATVRREIDRVFDDAGTRAVPAFRAAFLPGRAASPRCVRRAGSWEDPAQGAIVLPPVEA